MDDDLQHPIHFFDDEEPLFKTITRAGAIQVDDTCNSLSSPRGWFWTRFAPSERAGYLRLRAFVERARYDDFTESMGARRSGSPSSAYAMPSDPPRFRIDAWSRWSRRVPAAPPR